MKKRIVLVCFLAVTSIPSFSQKVLVEGIERGLSEQAVDRTLTKAALDKETSDLVGGLSSQEMLSGMLEVRLNTAAYASGAPELANMSIRLEKGEKGTFARDMKAWTLKMYRRLAPYRKNLKAPKEKLPQILPQEALYVVGFTHLTSAESSDIAFPKLPFVIEEGVAYRGMALESDGKSLHKILTQGILLEDCGKECNTLNLSYAGASGRGAMHHFISHPTINLTYRPDSAVYWGSKRLSAKKPLLVITRIRGNYASLSNINETQDIPLENVTDVLVALWKDNQWVWHKVEWKEDVELFKITPYEWMPPK